MTIQFGTLNIENGQAVVTNERTLSESTIRSCPNIIFDADHYHDGSCDCFDMTADHMADWGYVWDDNKKQWGS